MKRALHFLLAARHAELSELAALVRTAQLVRRVAAVVHELQRERGLSNLYLGALGQAHGPELQAAQAGVDAAVDRLRAGFEELDTALHAPAHAARLFGAIAQALQALAALPLLRSSVQRGRYDMRQSTAAYRGVMERLLGVVFEAADVSTDADITRLLVGLFNVMQCKECAGLERATGVALLAGGLEPALAAERLENLQEQQAAALVQFERFAPLATVRWWQAAERAMDDSGLQRLRRRLIASGQGGSPDPVPEAVPDSAMGPAWFQACTERIDRMRPLEDRLTDDLLALCHAKAALLEKELADAQALADRLAAEADACAWLQRYETPAPAWPVGDPGPALQGESGAGAGLDRSVLELLPEQGLRLQAMSAELDEARASLAERKLIERAKGLLMAGERLTEDEAHRLLRQAAMSSGRRLVDAAEAVLLQRTNSVPDRSRTHRS